MAQATKSAEMIIDANEIQNILEKDPKLLARQIYEKSLELDDSTARARWRRLFVDTLPKAYRWVVDAHVRNLVKANRVRSSWNDSANNPL